MFNNCIFQWDHFLKAWTSGLYIFLGERVGPHIFFFFGGGAQFNPSQLTGDINSSEHELDHRMSSNMATGFTEPARKTRERTSKLISFCNVISKGHNLTFSGFDFLESSHRCSPLPRAEIIHGPEYQSWDHRGMSWKPTIGHRSVLATKSPFYWLRVAPRGFLGFSVRSLTSGKHFSTRQTGSL